MIRSVYDLLENNRVSGRLAGVYRLLYSWLIFAIEVCLLIVFFALLSTAVGLMCFCFLIRNLYYDKFGR